MNAIEEQASSLPGASRQDACPTARFMGGPGLHDRMHDGTLKRGGDALSLQIQWRRAVPSLIFMRCAGELARSITWWKFTPLDWINRHLRLLPILLGVFVAGCTTVSLPPVNLKQPGWTIRQGQAVWHRQRGGEGIAGDILVATRPDGRGFVQFSKTPFPLVVGQIEPDRWQVEFPPQNKHYSGHGRPPQRIIFLQLPRVLSGLPPPKHWSWRRLDNHGWRLENGSSGESLDVYFNP